jgi:glutamine cyclotransferase
MSKNYTRYILLSTLILQLTWVISCSNSPGKGREPVANKPDSGNADNTPVFVKMVSPVEDSEFKLKNRIKVVIAPENGDKPIDSLRIYFDGSIVADLKSAPWEYSIPSELTGMTGRKSVKAVAFSKDKIQTITRFVIIYSDFVPETYYYKVIHTYPHDSEAFTQGLFYDNGKLYEGTGQEAGSTLREVELETGKVLRQHNLESSLFGEGITLYKNKIYQVTWRNKVGFVYEKATFSVINRIYYQTEGWGLTTVDDKIVMSDGTNVLYFFEPEMFTVTSRIEVYDNEKKVDQLNELEYINGEIWANIWQTDKTARIDPMSGKVNSYVDLSALFPQSKRVEAGADVLNGIAYDAQGGRIFVTGKRWPKLYEIKVTK